MENKLRKDVSVMYFDNEIPKYKKKKHKTVSKSNHKHIYKPCWIKTRIFDNETTLLSTYCIVCGKIKDTMFFLAKNNKIQRKYKLSNNDLTKIPVFYVEDIINTNTVFKN